MDVHVHEGDELHKINRRRSVCTKRVQGNLNVNHRPAREIAMAEEIATGGRRYHTRSRPKSIFRRALLQRNNAAAYLSPPAVVRCNAYALPRENTPATSHAFY